MPRASLKSTRRTIARAFQGGIVRSNREESPRVCHFLRVPLETRYAIYRLLLTTPYCTEIVPFERSLRFRLYTNILLVNKQISAEAMRVVLEQNDFVIFKVTGLNLNLTDVPVIDFLPEGQVINPVLRVEATFSGSKLYSKRSITLITTPEGIQPIITVLWRRAETDEYLNGSWAFVTPSLADLSLSLNFKVKSPTRCEALKNLVLKPWEKLHRIKQLSLTGDIGDSMRQHLERTMLEGPFPNEAALSLREYHSLGESEMAQKNYTAARWWWALFKDYWRHLGSLKIYLSKTHGMEDPNNELWNQVWTESNQMFLRGKLGRMKTYLHESKYEEAITSADNVLQEFHQPHFAFDSTVSPFLKTKFFLGKALAHTLLGDTKFSKQLILKKAAIHLIWSGLYNHKLKINNVKHISMMLQSSIDTEITRLKSRDPCEQLVYPRRGGSWLWQAECRSFWEWLDLPEA